MRNKFPSKTAYTLLFISAMATISAANAQIPPIVPTDVTGPTAGGVGAQGLLNNLGIGNGAYGSYGYNNRINQGLYGRVLTNPAVIPYSNQYLPPSLKLSEPYLMYYDYRY